ncbi:TPA: hypothetical protein ACKFQQ_004113 [Klebsiella variicola]|uniref:hypothetical protein n=1 Tax=Klebsiella variicola TaxID=244366 RepID=UPI000E2CBA76|nr:hypothetical protein [Klebsiella variicola]MBZ6720970.1 hypothetical protein [Klebsiella variicola]SXE96929.1 Uncharacterised protein [Klebsiella variicola]HCA5410833.1 hypothetical protein [Klebsiella variicola]HDK6252708.1 hypothetical protein [Klebsiella variicola]HDU5940607.1 hypothetical protein [Klebsiella variicola]
MTIRSHVDPILFVPFIHVQGTVLTTELESVVTALKLRHRDSFSPIMKQFHPRIRHIIFHETYHFWQGLRLPFMFRYAMMSYRLTVRAFATLSRHSANTLDWSCKIPEFDRLNVQSELGLSPNGKIQIGTSISTVRPVPQTIIHITPLLLLETAATLAEYNVTSSRNRTASGEFKRWRKRNPGYLEIFDACVTFLRSEELALRCLLPLINACFQTSKPELAFALLLGRTWGEFAHGGEYSAKFLAQPEPCRWTELYEIWLSELDFELDFEPKPNAVDVLDDAFYRLHLDDLVNGGFDGTGGFTHPFIGQAAKLWLSLAETDKSLLSVMDFPGSSKMETFNLCMTEMGPPISVYRFHLSSGNDRLIIHGNTEGKTGLDTIFLSLGFIADAMAMYGVVRAVSGAHFDADQRTCHHEVCPLYARNLCNTYPVVPTYFEQCKFTTRVDQLINKWRSS